MGATVWNPGDNVTVNADTTLKVENFTATAGQTVFTLTQFTYATGTHSLMVFLNGNMQRIGVDVLEVDPNNFQFASALKVGDIVSAWGFVGITATVAPAASGAANYYAGVATGTADVITALVPSYTAYTTGDTINFIALSANATATPTLNINSISAITIVDEDGAALVAGAIVAGKLHRVTYDGSKFRLNAVGIYAKTMSGYTFSGGSINNTPIGATTPSTGAFTTLSATGATILAATTVQGALISNNQFADGTASYVFYEAVPTDYGVGKPALYIKKNSTGSYAILNWDGTTSNVGAIQLNTGTLYFYANSALLIQLSSAGIGLAPLTAGVRLLGQFTNSTHANRLMFKTTSVNAATWVGAIPDGTGTQAGYIGYNSSDPNNSAYAAIDCTGTAARIISGINGTGTYVPIYIYTNGSIALVIDTASNAALNNSVPSAWNTSHNLDIGGVLGLSTRGDGSANFVYNAYYGAAGWTYKTAGSASLMQNTGSFNFYTAPSGTAGATFTPVQQVKITHVDNAVNYLVLQGGATGIAPSVTSAGGDVDVALTLNTKGVGAIKFFTGSVLQMQIQNTTSAVNYLTTFGGTTGNGVTIGSLGSDANVDIFVRAQGAGAINFATNTSNANVQVKISHVASAVNYLVLQGNATGNAPAMSVAGTDANISLYLITKGTGAVNFSTGSTANLQARVLNTASAVNYLTITGAATGGNPTISVAGSDVNVGLTLVTKGTDSFNFATNGNSTTVQVKIAHTASAVNYLTLTGAATSGSPALGVDGSDTDIGLVFTSKGTGAIDFNAGGATQLKINSLAGAVNYVNFQGSTTGNNVLFQAAGSDTNISFLIAAKGTGVIKLWNQNSVQAQVSGVASAVNYLNFSGAATGSGPILSAAGSDANIDLKLSSKGTGVISVTGIISTLTGQIKFPAVANLSADVNTLDDYEEGSWTPSLGGTASYSSRYGTYVKIGRRVFITGGIVVNLIGTGGTSQITGLPFAPSAANFTAGGICFTQFGTLATSVSSIIGYASSGGTIVCTGVPAAGGTSASVTALFGNSTSIDFFGSYETDV